MGKWIILNEILITAYYCWHHIRSQINDYRYIVLNLLIYICLRMVYYIFRDRKVRKYILSVLIIYIILIYFRVDKMFIVFLPLNIYFALYHLDVKLSINILAIFGIILFIDYSVKQDFIFISGTTYLFSTLFIKSNTKISRLISENDKLREKNYYLYTCLNKDKDYEKELKYLSQLEERNKIAQEIHDNIGHTISGSIMQLEAARLFMNKDTQKTDKMIENTIHVLRIGMEKIRLTLRENKPNSEELGIHRLKFLANKIEKESGIKINLFYDENIDKISYIQWKVILKNIRECITNTIKYAKASKMNIKIEVLNKVIKVEIKDNGVGSLNIKKGLGIIGMQERTENINGKLIIDGSSGFSVIILLPIKQNN